MRQVNLVDDQDKIIGQTSLIDAHRGKGKKHQAVSLFLFHQKKTGEFELLLQQRSKEKIVGNLQWANTLCANLSPSEDHLSCLKRRVWEELGFKWQNSWSLEKFMVFDYQVACDNNFSENEIDHLFISILSDNDFKKLQIRPNIEEVFDFAWENWNVILNQGVPEKKLTPWFSLFLGNKEIITKINQFLNLCQK